MQQSYRRKIMAIGFAAAALLGATTVSADPIHTFYYFNDGNGTCGYVSCGPNGCAPIMSFPCPREISGE